MKQTISVIGFCLFIFSSTAFSWDGYSYETGSYIDVESYAHKGQGEGELTDYTTGETYEVDMD